MKKYKWIIACLLTVLVGLGIYKGIKEYREYLRIKNAKVHIVLADDMTVPFYKEVKVSDFIKEINGTIIDDYMIDTTKLEKKTINYEYINEEDIKLKKSFEIEVVDKTPPLIWINSIINKTVNSKDTILENTLCGDDTDNEPKCYIDGDYNLSKTGKYKVVYKVEDKYGNKDSKDITINVYEPKKSSGSSSTSVNYKKFEDIIKKYKTDKTKIGIDISEWQDYPDYEKLKAAGVEFVIIRVGGTKGREGDYFLDKSFEHNINEANRVGLPVGLYFFSYATSVDKAKENAEWLLKQIKGKKVDLPISFDWENWSKFNQYHISFYELSKMADTFIDTVEKAGYKGMNYGSKTYLENMWFPTNNTIWLAHYTEKTNYEGDYTFWQLCDNALVDGINGPVDVNIMYEK